MLWTQINKDFGGVYPVLASDFGPSSRYNTYPTVQNTGYTTPYVSLREKVIKLTRVAFESVLEADGHAFDSNPGFGLGGFLGNGGSRRKRGAFRGFDDGSRLYLGVFGIGFLLDQAFRKVIFQLLDVDFELLLNHLRPLLSHEIFKLG